MPIEPKIRYDASQTLTESNISAAIVSGLRRTFDSNSSVSKRWTLTSSNAPNYDVTIDAYSCTHLVLTHPDGLGHLQIKTGITPSPDSKVTIQCRWVPDPTTIPTDPTDPNAELLFFKNFDDPLDPRYYPSDAQASPWCNISGNDPLSSIWRVETTRYITPSGGPVGIVYHGYADIIETEDSLTLALYQPEVVSLPGDLNYEEEHFVEESSQWLFALHAGFILTPDNESDPDWGITGEAIMSGWYGIYSSNGGKGTIARGMIKEDGSSLPGDCCSWMRMGYRADATPYTTVWERMLVNSSMTQGRTHEYTTTRTGDPSDHTLLRDLGSFERLAPYRIRSTDSGSTAITRFIRQRRFDLATLDLSDPVNIITPGDYRNSRDTRNEIAWIHQKAEYSYNDDLSTSRSNTIHIWRRDESIEEVDP